MHAVAFHPKVGTNASPRSLCLQFVLARPLLMAICCARFPTSMPLGVRRQKSSSSIPSAGTLLATLFPQRQVSKALRLETRKGITSQPVLLMAGCR